jgi:RNA polymerase sigma factor (sigma-70 family)
MHNTTVPRLTQINGKMPGFARASPDELVEQHQSLVIHVVRDFQRRLPPSVTFGDLVGAGNLGLVEAARRFDPTEGASFPTFARHRIRGSIVDSLRRIDPLSRRLRSFQRTAECLIELEGSADLLAWQARRRLPQSVLRWQRHLLVPEGDNYRSGRLRISGSPEDF